MQMSLAWTCIKRARPETNRASWVYLGSVGCARAITVVLLAKQFIWNRPLLLPMRLAIVLE